MNIPEGYKLVPVEPTKEMNKEGMRWLTGFQHMRANDKRNALSESFKAMLAAAPTPPQPIHSALNFVCTAMPGPGNECAFVELENDAGESLGHGEWRQRDDGLVELHIAAPQPIYDESSDLVSFEKWVTEECERDDTEPDFSLVANGEYENDILNIARRAWLAGAQSRAKSVEVGHE